MFMRSVWKKYQKKTVLVFTSGIYLSYSSAWCGIFSLKRKTNNDSACSMSTMTSALLKWARDRKFKSLFLRLFLRSTHKCSFEIRRDIVWIVKFLDDSMHFLMMTFKGLIGYVKQQVNRLLRIASYIVVENDTHTYVIDIFYFLRLLSNRVFF